MVTAFNLMGQTQSDTASFILASVPSAPLNGPTMVSQSGSIISITYNALTTVAETGGSVVLGYNLQMDDGLGGSFIDLYGSDLDPMTANTMVLSYTATNLVRGRLYGFRYRARNVYGYSTTFSPTTYIKAIEAPQQPPGAPVL